MDMLVSPLDIENVLTRICQLVAHAVPPVSLMLDIHLVTGLLWTIDADKQDIVAGSGAVHGEGVLFAQQRSVNAWTVACDSSSII